VFNSNYFGSAATYSLEMARHDLAGLAFTNSDALVAPHGGIAPFFGTNPFSFAMRGEAAGVPLLPQIEGLAFGAPARLLGDGAAADRRAPAPAAAPEPPPRRRGPWAAMGEIERVFEELPEVFGHHDLNRALGYDLDRGSARRNLQLLIEDGVLAAEQSESGHVRLLYRKLRATLPEVEE